MKAKWSLREVEQVRRKRALHEKCGHRNAYEIRRRTQAQINRRMRRVSKSDE